MRRGIVSMIGFFLIVLLLFGGATGSALAGGLADTPWPMFHHDLQHTGRSPYLGAQTPAKKWEFVSGGEVFSSPTIASNGTIYVGSYDNKLYAINPDGGKKWEFATGGRVHSSPAIASDGTIYVGSCDHKLYAVGEDYIPATIDIDPHTLNIESKGKWITCYIELPEEYSVEKISLATVTLECSDYTAYTAEGSPSQVGDYDEDGTPDLMVKFDRQDLAEYLKDNLDSFPQDVTLTVTGKVDSLTFTGEDTIRVISPGKGKTKAGSSEETNLETESSPEATELYQNYPNPFNPKTTIEYDLNKDSQVTLKIFSLSGQLIKLLVNENQSPGHYTITWYGDNEQGEEIASGVYFYQLLAGDKVLMKKMVVLK